MSVQPIMKNIIILLAISIGIVTITSRSSEHKSINSPSDLMCPKTTDQPSIPVNVYQNTGQDNTEFVVHCDRCQLGVYVHRDQDNQDHCTFCDVVKGN
jgi:hypothetical protein